MAGLKRNIEDAVSYSADVTKVRGALRKAIKAANKAIDELTETGVFYITDLQLSDLTDKLVDDVVDERLAKIDSLADDVEALSPGAVAFSKRNWESKRKLYKHILVPIQNLTKDFPLGKFLLRNGKVFCQNEDEVVALLTKTTVPSEVKEFYRLFANWHDDFKRLNDYARAHGFHEFTSTQVNFVDNPKAFVDAWFVGGLSVMPTAEMMARRQDQQTERKSNIVDRDGRAVM